MVSENSISPTPAPYPAEFYQPWSGPFIAWWPIFTPDRGKIWLRRYWRDPNGVAYARNWSFCRD
jgi:hypothetical protein